VPRRWGSGLRCWRKEQGGKIVVAGVAYRTWLEVGVDREVGDAIVVVVGLEVGVDQQGE
jgi:hypothetical protein